MAPAVRAGPVRTVRAGSARRSPRGMRCPKPVPLRSAPRPARCRSATRPTQAAAWPRGSVSNPSPPRRASVRPPTRSIATAPTTTATGSSTMSRRLTNTARMRSARRPFAFRVGAMRCATGALWTFNPTQRIAGDVEWYALQARSVLSTSARAVLRPYAARGARTSARTRTTAALASTSARRRTSAQCAPLPADAGVVE
jgi:hypothetical protein